jgi:2-dehydropantoate 2-reductase
MKKYRIAILGLGSVGGYLGAKLAAAKLPGLELIFIVRGETRDVIKENGLKLITDDGELVEYPQLISDDPAEIGRLDLLICAVKAYDLSGSLRKYVSCLDKESIILPLLNGIDIAAQIKKILPEPQVWEACIYLVARQTGQRGIIRQTGPANQIFFGSATACREELQGLDDLLKQAGLTASIAGDIDAELWKKFFFISVLGTVTSYYNAPIGLAQSDPEKTAQIRQMLDELERVALAKGIHLTPGLAQATYERILSLAPDATSSMYADFQKKGPTELEELTGEVVRLGKQYGVAVPVYDQMYRGLLR